MSTKISDLEHQIVTIVEGEGTKANKARELFGLGCERTDVVELLDMSYSQAHSIYKALESGEPAKEGWQRTRTGKYTKADVEVEARRQNNLHYSPMQVRYATQDGHRIVRVDTDRGPECRRCGAHLSFSIQWLAFLHTFSDEDPTEIQDKYVGEEPQSKIVIKSKRKVGE